MKKVAGFGLILVMLVAGSGWAQSTSPALYQTENKRIERYGEAIPQNSWEIITTVRTRIVRTMTTTVSADVRNSRGQQPNQTENNGYGSGPDYAWPSHLIEMGIRFAPSLDLNTAEGTGTYAGFRNNGAGVRMSVGPTLDYFFFKDRYAFSTGLWYTIKRSGFQMPGSFGETIWNPGASEKESIYNLQYLQIPATVKLFANNIGPNMRLYVQTGGLISIKLAEQALEPDPQWALHGGKWRHPAAVWFR